ncbi:MAG: ATP-binding protein [Acidobacteriota bacterium]
MNKTPCSTAIVGEYSAAFSRTRTLAPEDRKKELILIVDDSRSVRKVFSAVLSARYECIEAGSFDEAILELKKRDFALVLTDMIMPGLSGIELLRRVLQDFPGTEVIIASGVDRPQRALDAVRLGAFDYLIKPCEADVLEITVERALERRELILAAGKYKADLERQNTELVKRKEQLERMQAQIIQSEKMASLGQLSAGVAHELNNPVGFVYANLEMLDQYVSDLVRLITFYDEAEMPSAVEISASAIKKSIGYPIICDDIKSIIRDCCEGSDRIREIVQNLRTFSRLDEAEYNESDIHQGIDATVRLLSRYFSSGEITLIRNFGDLPPIGAFSGPLNQVWMNLLANAAQSIGPGKGQIKIITRADSENVFVEISDTGCGIALQHLNRIFDPFFTTKAVGDGTGLGLSISFGIVERHGGSITVKSRLTEGTTFVVRLPRHFEPENSPDEKAIVCYA